MQVEKNRPSQQDSVRHIAETLKSNVSAPCFMDFGIIKPLSDKQFVLFHPLNIYDSAILESILI